MLKTKDVEIDSGLTVTVRALPATEAADVMYRLSRALGPSVSALTQAMEGESLDLKILPEAVRMLFAGLPPAEFRELRELLLRDATYVQSETDEHKASTGPLFGKFGQGKLTHFDILFSGRLGKMFVLIWEALILNFGFSDAGSLEGMRERVSAAVSKFMSKGSLKSSGPAIASSLNE